MSTFACQASVVRQLCWVRCISRWCVLHLPVRLGEVHQEVSCGGLVSEGGVDSSGKGHWFIRQGPFASTHLPVKLGEVHWDVGGGQVEICLRQNKGHNLALFVSTSHHPMPLHHWLPILEHTKSHNRHPWTRTLPAALAGAEVCLFWPGTSLCTWSDADTQHGYQTYVSLSHFLSLSCCCLVAVCCSCALLLRFGLALLSCCSRCLLLSHYYLITILLLSHSLLLSCCSRFGLALVSCCCLVSLIPLIYHWSLLTLSHSSMPAIKCHIDLATTILISSTWPLCWNLLNINVHMLAHSCK